MEKNSNVITHTFENSSLIKEVYYVPETENLTVLFNNGSLYTYADVPRKALTGLKRASSAGRYFSNNIRGSYKHTFLGEQTVSRGRRNKRSK